MTEDELSKIPRYSITGQFPGLKQGAKVCYGASILWDEHRGRRAAGIASFLAALVEQFAIEPHVLANDTGNRYAIRVGQENLTEEQAILITQGEGQAWITDQAPVFAAYGIKETSNSRPTLEKTVFARWEDYRNSPYPDVKTEFARTHAAYCLLSELDHDHAVKLQKTAEGFMSRGTRTTLPPEQIERGVELCKQFLIEENAVFTMVGRRFDALVYTGPLLLCQEEPARGEFNLPDDLPLERLPDSIRLHMKADQKPVDALREALSGFDRLQWINIRRNKSYSPFADIEGLEKIRTTTRAMHYKREPVADHPTTMREIKSLGPISDGIEAFHDILNNPRPESPENPSRRIPPLRHEP